MKGRLPNFHQTEFDLAWSSLEQQRSQTSGAVRTSSTNGERDIEGSAFRQACLQVLKSNTAEWIVGALIFLNFVVVVVETDSAVDSGTVPHWVRSVDVSLMTVFTIELLLRLYVWRCLFFHKIVNVMDFVIISADVGCEVYGFTTKSSITSVAPLRIFRLMRLARGMKVIVKFPQLALLVKGMYRAMSAIFWGTMLLAGALTVCGILAVQFIHPVNLKVAQAGTYDDCDRCDRAYSSVGQAILTFVQQIVAGDSWGMVTVPIIEEQPVSAVFFALVFVLVSLAIMNVILSVIVDSALKVSQDDLSEVIRVKNREFKNVVGTFRNICADMDLDQSGDLTFDELVLGYKVNTAFHDHLEALDIREEDLGLVFTILDKDCSGKVDYREFAEELFRMKADNMHTLLVFIRYYVLEIRKGVQEQLRVMSSEILASIAEESSQAHLSMKEDLGVDLSYQSLTIEQKQKGSKLIGFTDKDNDLGEELRRLRTVISEDLVHSMKDMAQKSETHTNLLASIARDGHAPRSLADPLSPLVLSVSGSFERPSPRHHSPQRQGSAWGLEVDATLPVRPPRRAARHPEGCPGCCTVSRTSPERTVIGHPASRH